MAFSTKGIKRKEVQTLLDETLDFEVVFYEGRGGFYFGDKEQDFIYPCVLSLLNEKDTVQPEVFDALVVELAKSKKTYNEIEDTEVRDIVFTETVRHGKRNWFERITDFITLESGMCLEFGVHKGESIRILADYFSEVHGYDSFEGLPEDWHKADDTVVPQGKYAVDVPEVPKNVVLHQGWFDDTIDGTLNEPIMLLHIDSDLYSSAVTVLEKCNDYIVKNTVIAFDDYYPHRNEDIYPKWREGEHKALMEWCDKYDRKVKPILRDGFQGVCFVVEK